MTMHPHLAEELAHRDGPKLWDAGEGVCCAAYQLGACPHTEDDFGPDDEMTRAERVELYGEEAVADVERIIAEHDARMAATADECPF